MAHSSCIQQTGSVARRHERRRRVGRRGRCRGAHPCCTPRGCSACRHRGPHTAVSRACCSDEPSCRIRLRIGIACHRRAGRKNKGRCHCPSPTRRSGRTLHTRSACRLREACRTACPPRGGIGCSRHICTSSGSSDRSNPRCPAAAGRACCRCSARAQVCTSRSGSKAHEYDWGLIHGCSLGAST